MVRGLDAACIACTPGGNSDEYGTKVETSSRKRDRSGRPPAESDLADARAAALRLGCLRWCTGGPRRPRRACWPNSATVEVILASDPRFCARAAACPDRAVAVLKLLDAFRHGSRGSGRCCTRSSSDRPSSSSSAARAVRACRHSAGSPRPAGSIVPPASAPCHDQRSSRAIFAASSRKRGSTCAGSQTTRRRRQAGPPPLRIDSRTSTKCTARIGVAGDQPCRDKRRRGVLARFGTAGSAPCRRPAASPVAN